MLGNQNAGDSWHASASLTKRFRQGMLKGAYSYGESKNTVDPGSIAFGSWTGNAIAGDPNNPPVAYSNQFPGHRVFLTGSYRFEYKNFGATTLSFFWQGYTNGVASYVYAADLNGDLGTSNDLIYIPRNTSEMNFETFTQTVNGAPHVFTAGRAGRGLGRLHQPGPLPEPAPRRVRGAQRGALCRWCTGSTSAWRRICSRTSAAGVTRCSSGPTSSTSRTCSTTDWGVGQRFVGTTTAGLNQPLTNTAVDANGAARYRLRVVNGELLSKTFETTAGPVGRLPDPVQPALQLQLGRPGAASGAGRFAPGPSFF